MFCCGRFSRLQLDLSLMLYCRCQETLLMKLNLPVTGQERMIDKDELSPRLMKWFQPFAISRSVIQSPAPAAVIVDRQQKDVTFC